MEGRKTVILQSHLDMVPQKNSSVKHDFLTDPIDAYIDGDWVTARETTLVPTMASVLRWLWRCFLIRLSST